MSKKVLITGVAGMIGSHLSDQLLRNGITVTGIDNLSFGNIQNLENSLKYNKFKFVNADILDLNRIIELTKDHDTIVHLAAVKKINEHTSAIPTLCVNVNGTENILKAASKWKCKVILASTSDVYGLCEKLPFNENDDLIIGPSNFKRWAYAVSKLQCEQLTLSYFKDLNVDSVILRYFGGYSNRSKLFWSGGHIPLFMSSIINNKEIEVHGDGSQTRSMAFITDIINGTILAMNTQKAVGEIINIGNDEEISIIESAKIINNVINPEKDLKVKYIKMDTLFGNGYKEIMRRKPDLSKARKLLNYKPKVSFIEGIKETYESMMANRNKSM